MAYASWIPASPGRGMPRYPFGSYGTSDAVWNAQVGLSRSGGFSDCYGAFDTAANMVYYTGVQINAAASKSTNWQSPANNGRPLCGITLAFWGSVTSYPQTQTAGLASLKLTPSGIYDSGYQGVIDNFWKAGYSEAWIRLNHEANFPTCPGGCWNGAVAQGWEPAFKAAFEHVYQVLHAQAALRGIACRVLFDTCPISGPTLANYKPDAAYYDAVGVDLYSNNVYVPTDTSYPGYSSGAAFATTWTERSSPANSNDTSLWAVDFDSHAGTTNYQFPTYDNMAHYLCFQDMARGRTAAQSAKSWGLYAILQQCCIADQKPILHPELGTFSNTTAAGGKYLTAPNSATHGVAADYNYFPWVKKMIAGIEDMGVPHLGGCIWDYLSLGGGFYNLLSGPDSYSGGYSPGQRSTIKTFGFPLSGAPATPALYLLVPQQVPQGTPFEVDMNGNFSLTMANINVSFDGATAVALSTLTGAAVSGQSAKFTYTSTTLGTHTITITDATDGCVPQTGSYITNIAPPVGASIAIPTTIPTQTAGQLFKIQAAFSYAPNKSNVAVMPTLAGSTTDITAQGGSYTPIAAFTGATWDATNQILTIPYTLQSQTLHTFQVIDTSYSPPIVSPNGTIAVSTSGGGGTIAVTAPPVTTVETLQAGCSANAFVLGSATPLTFTVNSSLAMTLANMKLAIQGGTPAALPSGAALTNNNLTLTFNYTPLTAGAFDFTIVDTGTTPNPTSNVLAVTVSSPVVVGPTATLTLAKVPDQFTGAVFIVQCVGNYTETLSNLYYNPTDTSDAGFIAVGSAGSLDALGETLTLTVTAPTAANGSVPLTIWDKSNNTRSNTVRYAVTVQQTTFTKSRYSLVTTSPSGVRQVEFYDVPYGGTVTLTGPVSS